MGAKQRHCSATKNCKDDDKNYTKKILDCLKEFKPSRLISFDKFVQLMYQPTDAASIGVCRMLFGFSMLLDIPDERGGANLDVRWGNPRECKFPLFAWIKPLSLQYMGLLYALMYLGAFGIMIGWRMRLSCSLFAVPYWYIFLLDKSVWNNHSYLYGLIVLLYFGTSSTNYCSVRSRKHKEQTVPYWNYFILKYQFIILYFVAGLKKLSAEWLSGHAMTHLTRHWVFIPFTTFISTEMADLLIVHWFGCFFDLTVAFLLLIESTRPLAMLFAIAFHLMNSRLFSIGMFPWVCLAELPLFCRPDWPRKVSSFLKFEKYTKPGVDVKESKVDGRKDLHDFVEIKKPLEWKQRFVCILLLSHCGIQAFLPYSHFITKGYNNWTDGLYGYSWDMMVHAWDTVLVSIRVHDNQSNLSHYLDPSAWTANDRWSKHGDMSHQYAKCLKTNLLMDYNINMNKSRGPISISNDMSIYIDVWCSLNGRFQQRMFDPRIDLLKVDWSPFQEVSWLLPLLRQFTDYRSKMAEIQKEVYSWSNFTEVLFVADFPGLFLENYISEDLENVTLTVLHGQIKYEDENERFSKQLNTNQHLQIIHEGFHKVFTIGNIPACYMYTYINKTRTVHDLRDDLVDLERPKLDIVKEFGHRLRNAFKFYEHICNSFLNIITRSSVIKCKTLFQ